MNIERKAKNNPELEPSDIIALLNLVPLPDEGGLWSQVALDETSSAIYYLLVGTDFSAMHRLPNDEIYHFYAGAPLQLLVLNDASKIQRPVLGTDLTAGQRPAVIVKGGSWQGSRSLGPWSLVGTTMAPPFAFETFELGERKQLHTEFPKAAAEITRLTRNA